eukprot:COSAG02_NODE_5062_length_4680_cov_3.865095_4_plen_450_part_00
MLHPVASCANRHKAKSPNYKSASRPSLKTAQIAQNSTSIGLTKFRTSPMYGFFKSTLMCPKLDLAPNYGARASWPRRAPSARALAASCSLAGDQVRSRAAPRSGVSFATASDTKYAGSCAVRVNESGCVMELQLHQLGGDLSIELESDCGDKQGLGLWTLGLAAASWASSDEGRREVTGRRVLEIGSGVGLAGLACGAAAEEVTLTDYDEQVLHKLRRHVARNQARLQPTTFRVARLDWDAAPAEQPHAVRERRACAGSAVQLEPEPEPELPDDLQVVLGRPTRPFDVVLGADVCYSGMSQVPDLFASDDSDSDTEMNVSAKSDEERQAALRAKRFSTKLSWDNSANVAQTLAWCMARPHGVAHLFVHEGRSPDEVARFTSRAEELGMSVADRVPLLQRDFVCGQPACTGDVAGTPIPAPSAPQCMHDYMTDSGLIRLKICWATAANSC